MNRIKAVLEYDGTAYRGWQRQPDATTVQGTCERAIAKVVGDPVDVVASGRTDSGVHARGQTVHVDVDAGIDPPDLRRAWNAYLPDDVWVRELAPAPSGFHARHDARARTYRYYVAHGPRARSPFVSRYHWSLDRPVDWDRIERATGRLTGTHDFRRFAKGSKRARRRAGRPPGRCTVAGAAWRSVPAGRMLEITADRYLRHMVRALVGTLIDIGRDRVTIAELERALEPGGERPSAGYAPPRGLFLWRVEYADDA
ncbi:MAG: tRNA pseudouridine(38-40) synthase TruA [Gemmatimonadota bacterium]|nr:tRNA pseudouridine(38-40) synthase TruA [Gemmatimonadota bacterium]